VPREEARAIRYGHTIGVLMIDVNRFKEINNRFGHQMGDRVLQAVADVFRYGGDEFLLILPETNGKPTLVKDRILAKVARRNEANQRWTSL